MCGKCSYLSSTNFPRRLITMFEMMVLYFYKNVLTALLATIGLAEELSDQNECDVNIADNRTVADCINRNFTTIPLNDRTVKKLIKDIDSVTGVSFEDENDCNVIITDHRKVADCINRSFTNIPLTDREVEKLIVSYNPIKEIRNEEIRFYEKLWSFIYIGTDSKATIRALVVHENAFLNSTALEFLTIQNVNLNPSKRISFPLSIKQLHFPSTYFRSQNLDVSNLKSLEIANFRDNILTDFPRFSKYAPLTSINVLENPMKITAVGVEEIAGYCHLKRLEINITEEFTKNYCTCIKLQKWINLREIKGLDPADFKCEPSVRKCKIPGITPTMRVNYYTCWNKDLRNVIHFVEDDSIYFDRVLLILICLLVVLLVVMHVLLIVIIFKSRQKIKQRIDRKGLTILNTSLSIRIEEDSQDEEI